MELKRFFVEPLPRISDAFYLLTAQTYHYESYDPIDHRCPTTILFGPLGDIPGVITFFFPSDPQAQVLSFDTGLTGEDRLVQVEQCTLGRILDNRLDGMRVTFQSKVAVSFIMVRVPDAGVRVLRWSEQDSKAHPDLRLLFVKRNRRKSRRPVTYVFCLQVRSDFDPSWEIIDATP